MTHPLFYLPEHPYMCIRIQRQCWSNYVQQKGYHDVPIISQHSTHSRLYVDIWVYYFKFAWFFVVFSVKVMQIASNYHIKQKSHSRHNALVLVLDKKRYTILDKSLTCDVSVMQSFIHLRFYQVDECTQIQLIIE